MRKSTPHQVIHGSTRAGAFAIIAGFAALIAGCNVDSYLDPSVVGQWEPTAKVQPILKRLAVIEGTDDGLADISEISPSDLLPEVEEYRVGPGDVLSVTAYDLNGEGPNIMEVRISPNGEITIASLGQIFVNGRTLSEVEQAVEEAMTALVRNPLASVTVSVPRQTLYTTVGAVAAVGQWPLERADLRLLDALAIASWFPEHTKEIFIFRQVPLVDSDLSPRAFESTDPGNPAGNDAGSILDMIDDLSGGGGAPGVLSRDGVRRERQPETTSQPDPLVNLIESGADPTQTQSTSRGSSWIYLNDKWVRVQRDSTDMARVAAQAGGGTSLFTQRVIRVPVEQLLAGNANVNIVIRAGDIIHVPMPQSGFVYLAGQAARPGAFSLVPDLTLLRLIDSASGLGSLAIPERVDITRMLSGDRQATMRLNLRAIAEGSQPDLYLRDGDRINIGTNAFALPLAVIRSGFRATYGFGFLLDRNFGNDVFGSPPIRRF